jgi:eukaryotic-like serine/threonine-protein kinase
MQSNEANCATNMTPERWQQVKEIFNSAIQYEPKGRAAFLSQECGGDEALRREVESLLQSHDESNSFLEQPAVENAAEMLVNEQPQLSAGQRIGHYEIVKLALADGIEMNKGDHDAKPNS